MNFDFKKRQRYAFMQATGSLLAQLEELDMALSLLFLDSSR
jgi:hypothetical protein